MRQVIAAAALTVFQRDGYETASLRAVAREAGVDPALVHHYFTDRTALLLAAVSIPLDIDLQLAPVLEADPREMGVAIMRRSVETWDSPLGPLMVALIVESPDLLPVVESFVKTDIAGRILHRLRVPEREIPRRLTLLGSIMVGLVLTRYILKVQPMADLPSADLIATMAPVVQQALTGPLPATPRATPAWPART